MIRALVSLFTMIFSAYAVSADFYNLDPKLSSIGLSTIKSQFIVEAAQVNHLEGTLNENGEFEIVVDLSQIDTGISIRDSRISEIFFEHPKNTPVKVTGKLK